MATERLKWDDRMNENQKRYFLKKHGYSSKNAKKAYKELPDGAKWKLTYKHKLGRGK